MGARQPTLWTLCVISQNGLEAWRRLCQAGAETCTTETMRILTDILDASLPEGTFGHNLHLLGHMMRYAVATATRWGDLLNISTLNDKTMGSPIGLLKATVVVRTSFTQAPELPG